MHASLMKLVGFSNASDRKPSCTHKALRSTSGKRKGLGPDQLGWRGERWRERESHITFLGEMLGQKDWLVNNHIVQ